MNQMVNKNKKNSNNNSSNSLVFGQWPQTTTTTTQVIPWILANGHRQKDSSNCFEGIVFFICGNMIGYRFWSQ